MNKPTKHISSDDYEVKERWYLNGKIHREDGPAYTSWIEGGQILYKRIWMQNDEYHREDGPAGIYYNDDGNIDSEVWYINGECHKLDGPAWIGYENGKIYNTQYWIRGLLYSKEEWEQNPEVLEHTMNQLINKELL